ncbi:MAG: hypothetical protein AAGC60_09625 [Acidobacteriota bacterium]
MSAISPGFDLAEATALLEITQQTYDKTPGEPLSQPTPGVPPVPDPPAAWTLDTDLTPTEATLLDNFWQVWRNSDTGAYAIAVRGTVQTPASIFEDVFLPLLSARASLSLKACGIDTTLSLDLARDEGESAVVAGVHAGFTLGLLLSLFTTDAPLLATLVELDAEGAQVFIAGHSQGASVATLLTSFVRHSSLLSDLQTKTYVFAPAKPGNDHYADDYNQIVGVPGLGFSVVSSQDWVPQVPLTLQGLQATNTPNPVCSYEGTTTCTLGRALGGTQNAELTTLENARDTLAEQTRGRLESTAARVKSGLPQATFGVTAAQLGAAPSDVEGGDAASSVIGAACVESLIDQLISQVLPSLNFTRAGAIVPAFATPGANPKDPSDMFWQHHLGNYLKYLTAQYA